MKKNRKKSDTQALGIIREDEEAVYAEQSDREVAESSPTIEFKEKLIFEKEKKQKHIEKGMLKFDPSLYYFSMNQDKAFKLLPAGTKLAAQYYVETYNANISIPDIDMMNLDKFSLNLSQSIPSEVSGEYRQAYLIGVNSTHIIPITYIIDNHRKAILYADSIGIQTPPKILGVTGYAVTDRRQSDRYSCYVDALIIAKDATAKNALTNQYELQDLLHMLEKRAKEVPGEPYLKVKLPDKLLKTTQNEEFIQAHKENSSAAKVHKEETLFGFRERYFNKTTSQSSYLKEKGLKLTHTIEIQFYINQMIKEGVVLSEEQRKEFINKSKDILCPEGKRALFSHDSDQNKEYITASEVLYQFAQQFLEDINSKLENKYGL